MQYSAIIFDLDGTAMPSQIDALPSARMVEVARRYAGEFNLCAATGRTWRHAKPIVRALGLQKPCILSGGAMIIDPLSEQVLWQEVMPEATAKQIINIARGFPYVVSFAQGLVLDDPIDPNGINISGDVNTIYILDIAKGDEAGVVEALAGVEEITISKAASWNVADGVDLHITNHESTKEHAVGVLCEMLGVQSKDVAGVGDGHNDIHLFKAVGHKVAMGNAVQDLKDASDEVVASIDDDGLADFITCTYDPTLNS